MNHQPLSYTGQLVATGAVEYRFLLNCEHQVKRMKDLSFPKMLINKSVFPHILFLQCD